MHPVEIFGQLVLGWLIADLLSGVGHWWEDRVGRADLPLVGPAVIAPNRRHHIEPLAFLESGVVERNLALWVLVGIVSGLWAWLGGFSPMWAAATIGGLAVNEVHAWAHRPAAAPGFVRVLQQTGLLQSPPHHAAHHRGDHDRRYCILTDWLNPVLDALRVWARLEAAMARVGLEPNRGTR